MANLEVQYEKSFREFLEEAKTISDTYEAANPECAIKFDQAAPKSCEYRSQGWQEGRTHTWYKELPNGDYEGKCPRCAAQGKSLKSKSINAGCRMNGDGYGSSLIYCDKCGLFDFSSWDQA